MSEPFHLFSYYGAKNRLAARYPVPQYDTLVEPFAGSAAYACRHYRRQVILYDKDPVVCGVLAYLIRSTPAEIAALPLLYEGESVKDLNLAQEAKWLIGFWLNTCSASPSSKRSVWGREGLKTPRNSVWSVGVRSMVAHAVRHIKHWRVYNKSWDEIPTHQSACWFVDPPYQDMGKYYRHGSDGIDFPALGEWCQRLPGQVIVCENFGADWLPFTRFKSERGQRNKGDKAEAIWTQGCTKGGFGLV